MKTKAQIRERIKEVEDAINELDLTRETYNFNLGKLKALNWVLNSD